MNPRQNRHGSPTQASYLTIGSRKLSASEISRGRPTSSQALLLYRYIFSYSSQNTQFQATANVDSNWQPLDSNRTIHERI